MKMITYQGIPGAFSHLTALKAFGPDESYLGKETFLGVFEALTGGEADYAMIAIENSLIGAIYENYDLLNAYDVTIINEQYTRIEHCLWSIPRQKSHTGRDRHERIRSLKRVLSHPKALEQCTRFFRTHPWIEAVEYFDTAAAAQAVAQMDDPDAGAIASRLAGRLYGLELIADGIEDDPQNYTRFVGVSRKAEEDREANKCSLLLKLKHEAGALERVVALFAKHGFNLTKIESRPVVGIPFEYLFYLDFIFPKEKRREVEVVLEEIAKEALLAKRLGTYRAGKM